MIVDRREGADIVEVAHESLLRQWPSLTEWLHAVAEDLGIVASVERAAGEWDRNSRRPAWLDHRGDRLAAAERVAARQDFRRRLGAKGMDYLRACRQRETRQRRIAQTIAWGVAAVFAVFSVLLFNQWRHTVQAQRETEASLLVVKSELDLENDNTDAAVMEAEQAFHSIPTADTRSALLQAVMEISPHEGAVLPLRKPLQTLAWTADNVIDFAAGEERLGAIDPSGAIKISAGSALPVIKRRQDGNIAAVRALAPLDNSRMVVVFDEGSIGTYRPGGDEFLLQPHRQNISVGPTQHSVAISKGGALLALVTADATIVIYRCGWSAAPASAPACQSSPLGDVHGQAVAISPDEKRIAVGDRAGNVALYDLAGKPLGTPQKFNAPINALGWAAQRDWLAVGTLKGEIAVLDTSFARNARRSAPDVWRKFHLRAVLEPERGRSRFRVQQHCGVPVAGRNR